MKTIEVLEKTIQNVNDYILNADHSQPTSLNLIIDDELTQKQIAYVEGIIKSLESFEVFRNEDDDLILNTNQLNEMLDDLKIEYANQVLEIKPKFKAFSPRENKMVNLSVQNPILAEFISIDTDLHINTIKDGEKYIKPISFTIIFGKLSNGKEGYVIFDETNKLIHKNLSGRISSEAKMNAIENEVIPIVEDAFIWVENKYDTGVNMVYNRLT